MCKTSLLMSSAFRVDFFDADQYSNPRDVVASPPLPASPPERPGELARLLSKFAKPKANVSCQLNFRLFVSCQLKFWAFFSCQVIPSKPSLSSGKNLMKC